MCKQGEELSAGSTAGQNTITIALSCAGFVSGVCMQASKHLEAQLLKRGSCHGKAMGSVMTKCMSTPCVKINK